MHASTTAKHTHTYTHTHAQHHDRSRRLIHTLQRFVHACFNNNNNNTQTHTHKHNITTGLEGSSTPSSDRFPIEPCGPLRCSGSLGLGLPLTEYIGHKSNGTQGTGIWKQETGELLFYLRGQAPTYVIPEVSAHTCASFTLKTFQYWTLNTCIPAYTGGKLEQMPFLISICHPKHTHEILLVRFVLFAWRGAYVCYIHPR